MERASLLKGRARQPNERAIGDTQGNTQSLQKVGRVKPEDVAKSLNEDPDTVHHQIAQAFAEDLIAANANFKDSMDGPVISQVKMIYGLTRKGMEVVGNNDSQ